MVARRVQHVTLAAVVIVTHAPPPGVLERAVTSVIDCSSDIAIYVIDNGGAASSRLAAVVAPPSGRVHVVTTENHGFGAAANVGIHRAIGDGAQVIAVLNDDVEVQPGWLELLVAEFADDGVGAVQPLLVASDGRTVNSAGVDIDRFGAGSDRWRGRPLDEVVTGPCDVEVFTGGAVVVSAAFIGAVGGFDERFFLYYEDVELARRGTAAGWRYRLVPSSRVTHLGSATTARLGDDVIRLRERNRIWSVAMQGSWSELGVALWLTVRRIRQRPRRAHLLGLVGGVAGALPRRIGRGRRPVT